MSVKCNSCALKPKCRKDKKCELLKPKYGKITHIVGVISGKGGVGKSTITGIIAVMLKKLGKKVGVLDADITGPSMPRFFGIEDQRSGYRPTDNPNEIKLVPKYSNLGIAVQSMNLMIDEEEPVMWKGPILSNVLTQLYTDTDWGELDYLLIDMPPGTGDVAITIMDKFPIDQLVIVSTPQNMVTMIVNKIVNMAKKQDVPIKGIIQNMSYLVCDECGKKHNVFTRNSADEVSFAMGLNHICELPIDPIFTEYLEMGQGEIYADINKAYEVIMEAFRDDEEEIFTRNKNNKKRSLPILGLGLN